MHNRVDLDLAVSRAVGDQRFKESEDLPPEEQKVSAEPDIKKLTMNEDSLFLVIACDGIWDCKTNDQCIEFLNDKHEEMRDEGYDDGFQIDELFKECISPDPEDQS